MHPFAFMADYIAHAWTGRALKVKLWALGLTAPAEVTMMYLRGEEPEYIIAACLAIETIGA